MSNILILCLNDLIPVWMRFSTKYLLLLYEIAVWGVRSAKKMLPPVIHCCYLRFFKLLRRWVLLSKCVMRNPHRDKNGCFIHEALALTCFSLTNSHMCWFIKKQKCRKGPSQDVHIFHFLYDNSSWDIDCNRQEGKCPWPLLKRAMEKRPKEA